MKIISSVLNGHGSIRIPAGIRIPLFTILLLIAGSLLVAGCSDDSGDPGFPTPPKPEPDNFLFDVYGRSADDVYVCGDRGAMFHFDGTDWSDVDMGVGTAITTLWSPPDDNTLYAVGHGGHIWRNTSGSWSGMTSGTTGDLYGIGQHDGQIHAVGDKGLVLRLSGSSWGGIPSQMWILDENGGPTDTLSVKDDLASVVAVNEFFLGGAYYLPDYEDELIGRYGTRGMVFTAADPADFPAHVPPDPAWSDLPDWILRPISGEQTSPYEWVYAMTSDPADYDRNLLGTSEGWLFRMTEDFGKKVWSKFYPKVTVDPDRGIRDIWLDAAGNIYMVTDAGTVVYQTFDYNFTAGTGERVTLYDGPVSLHGIWGTGPDNLFIVGNMDETMLRVSHDQGTHEFLVTEVTLTFPEAKSADAGPSYGRFGELRQ